MKKLRWLLVGGILAATLAGCDDGHKATAQNQASQRITQHADSRVPYEPKHDVEFNNYNRAQKLYDQPDTIIWCTTTWGNPSAPIVTMPVAGKLTSSSVSFFPSKKWVDRGNYSWNEVEQRSVDGMYHGTPPPYRYGFTPGGQYMELFNMPAVCTTAMTKFQRQKTILSTSLDPAAAKATQEAEAALKSNDPKAAQKALDGLDG